MNLPGLDGKLWLTPVRISDKHPAVGSVYAHPSTRRSVEVMDHTIVHFEIPADDLDRAVAFYREVFGWEISKMPGPFEYYGVKTTATDETGMPKGPGVNGGVMKRGAPRPKPAQYNGAAPHRAPPPQGPAPPGGGGAP